MQGVVVKSSGSVYGVRTNNGAYIDCRVKGNFRLKGIRSTNPVAVGDIVTFDMREDGTAYITDLGMCGPVQSVLGIEPELTIRKFKSNLPVRFENAKGEYSLDGCLIDIDEKTGKANSIERVNIR